MTTDIDVQNINKRIRINGGKSTGKSMNHIVENLNYFLKSFLNTEKKEPKFATEYSIWNQE